MGLLDDFTEEEILEKEKEEKTEEVEGKEGKGIFLECDENKKSIPTREKATYKVNLVNTSSSSRKVELRIHLLYSSDKEEPLPWQIRVFKVEKLTEPSDTFEKVIELEGGEEKTIPVEVSAPEGASYGDKAEVIIDATSTKDKMLSDSITLITTARPAVVAMKTQINQEKNVADYIASWSEDKDLGVFSILAPKPVRGYIFIEAMNPTMVDEITDGTRKAKGIIGGETSIEEIEHFLAPKLAVEGIAEGDIVELSAGPFKGEKARVAQIDRDNDEITVELFEATVPIPVTVRGDHVRVLEKD
ncbi:MAG: transcription elongation factor Spt5 [Candidatus Aenigmatarchaeota archaeon]